MGLHHNPMDELATLTVEYVVNQQTRFRLSDTVNSFIQHLLHCFNGLQGSDCRGKKLYLKRNGPELNKQATLDDCGVQDGSYLVLHGYKPLSRIKFTISVIGIDGDILSLEVINMTSLKDLKHRLQNQTGIHESELELYHKGKRVTSKLKSVEFYSGKHASRQLLQVKQTGKSSEDDVAQVAPVNMNPDVSLRQNRVGSATPSREF